MLFATTVELQNIMPWVIVVLATVMLASIIGKCIAIYRNLKRNRTYVKRDRQNTPNEDTHDDENI